jgi:NADPH:quinone reductase-like Zn-dependent oxidoreductase
MVGGEEGGNLTGGMDRQLRGAVLSLFSGKKLRGFLSRERGNVLEDIAGLLATDTVTPSIDQTYPLAQAPEAMRHLESGRVGGKVAIRV